MPPQDLMQNVRHARAVIIVLKVKKGHGHILVYSTNNNASLHFHWFFLQHVCEVFHVNLRSLF